MPPACIANTVYGTLSNSVATISCTGSGTVIVSQNMKTPANTDSPFPDMQGPNPERKNTMAFLGRQSATLAPVLFCIGENNGDPNESHLFMLPCEPAARIDKLQSSITNLINGTIRGVVAVEPCQSFGLIYGAHDIIVVELTDKLNVIRTLQCDFEIEDVTASTWSTSQNEDDLHLTIVAVGCESSKQVSATTFSARDNNTNNTSKQRLEAIENLEIPDTFDEEDEQQHQQQQEKDLIVSQTLQSANKSSPGAFIWWACWSNGLVTACFIESHADDGEENSVAAISLLQGIPELKQERYVAPTLNICASHSTNNIAIWSTLNDAVTMVSTGTTFKEGDDNGQQQQPVAFHRSSEVLSVATPALATRAIRGGAFMMMVGLFPNDQIPWTHLVPLYNQLSAHSIVQPSTTGSVATTETGGGALQLARALLSVDNSQLNETVNQIEVILDSVEQRINGQSDHDLQTLDALEKQLNQLRICRTSLVRRVEIERVASRSATAPLGRAREWDRRLHSAFVLLHICRFFVSSKNSSSITNNNNSTSSSHHQALHNRRSTNSQSFLKAVEEELKIPQDLDEYSQWIQASWPARLAIEHACEEVGLFTCTELFNNPMKQFQKMVETSLDSVDGSLEWLAFFALYFFGSSSSNCEATNTFVNALKLPPSVVSLARMARVIDNGNENNTTTSSSDEIIITVEEASRLANDTSCIPVRVLMNTLFCGLCDEGALTAAYSMTSTMTVTSLIRGDNKNAFAREVALRLAFLSSQKRNTSILSILLDHVLATPHSARNFDDRALVIYVISAAVSVAARDETLFLFEGKLTDTFDQNFTLAQLSAFGAEKLKVELLVQLQRHAEALDAAQKYQSSNQAEQHWIGVVTSHLRSIVPHEDVKKTGNSSSSLMMFAAVGDDDAAKLSSISSTANRGGVKSSNDNNNNTVALDADVVRPVPAAFYLSHHASGSKNRNSSSHHHQRCKVYMKKTGTECGCQVPCPYHSASSQHAVAMN